MRIMIVTDAWRPQVNGVVRTLTETCRELGELGHNVSMITPLDFRTFPCPTYPDIRLSWRPYAKVAAMMSSSVCVVGLKLKASVLPTSLAVGSSMLIFVA